MLRRQVTVFFDVGDFAKVAHDELEVALVLGAVRVEDLAVFSSDDLRVSLSEKFEERYFAGAEEELGLGVKDVNGEVPFLEVLDQLHRLVLNVALCWIDVELD